VQDQTFGEDASQVRTGHAPRLMAAVRNLTISLMNRIALCNKAAAQRHYAAQPHQALALINAPTEN